MGAAPPSEGGLAAGGVRGPWQRGGKDRVSDQIQQVGQGRCEERDHAETRAGPTDSETRRKTVQGDVGTEERDRWTPMDRQGPDE